MNNSNPQTFNADEFIDVMKNTGPALEGFVAYDPSKPDHILFGRSPFGCPTIPIAKELILSIQPNRTLPCTGSNPSVRQMWSAIVILKASTSPEGELLAAMLAAPPQEAPNLSGCSSEATSAAPPQCCQCGSDNSDTVESGNWYFRCYTPSGVETRGPYSSSSTCGYDRRFALCPNGKGPCVRY